VLFYLFYFIAFDLSLKLELSDAMILVFELGLEFFHKSLLVNLCEIESHWLRLSSHSLSFRRDCYLLRCFF